MKWAAACCCVSGWLLLGAGAAQAQPASDGAASSLGAAIAQRAHDQGEADGRWCVRLRGERDPSMSSFETGLRNTIVAGLGERGHEVHQVAFSGDLEAPERAHRLGYARLLDVEVTRSDAALTVSATLHRTQPAALLDTFTRTLALDARLRRELGVFPPVLLAEAVEARRGPLAGSGYLAMAIADLDGDRRGELITTTLRGVQVFAVELYTHPRRGARLRTRLLGEVRWPADLPRASSRRRRTVASIRADDRGAVVRTSEHAVGVRVTWRAGELQLAAETECDGYVLDAGCAVLVEGRDFFDETFAGEDPHVATANFYLHRDGRFTDREGQERRFEALITTAGRLSVRTTEEGEERARTTAAVGYGVALAMSDLDLDGRPELLASHASAHDAPDQLTLLRARGRGTLRVVWRSEPTRGPIWAAASGDIDGDGLDELLAIEAPTGNRRGRSFLWVVQ